MSGYKEEYNTLHIHIPKTGGTSVRQSKYIETEMAHATIHYFKERMQSDIFEKAFKCSFVRNPYTRFLSLAAYHSRLSTIDTFLDEVKDLTYVVYPQAYFICDDDDNILVDFMGRFEYIEDEWKRLWDELGVPREELAHKKKRRETVDKDKKYYTQDLLEQVNEYYERDFRIFGYKMNEDVNESMEVMPLANPLSTKKEVLKRELS